MKILSLRIVVIMLALACTQCKKAESLASDEKIAVTKALPVQEQSPSVEDTAPMEIEQLDYHSEPAEEISEEQMIMKKYGDNSATVIFENSGCDYIILETSDYWYVVAQKYSGAYSLTTGDTVIGKLASFGFKDVYDPSSSQEMRLYVDNYYATRDYAMERYAEKCE